MITTVHIFRTDGSVQSRFDLDGRISEADRKTIRRLWAPYTVHFTTER